MDERSITMATGVLPPRRQKLIRYYARLSELERIGVHTDQTDLMRRHRASWRHSQEGLAYCMLIKSLDERYRLAHIGSARNVSAEDLKKAEKQEIDKIKSGRTKSKRGSKRDELVLHVPLMRRLIEEHNFSWREIVAFLKNQFGLSVAPSYALKIYQESGYAQAVPQGRLPALPAEDKSDA